MDNIIFGAAILPSPSSVNDKPRSFAIVPLSELSVGFGRSIWQKCMIFQTRSFRQKQALGRQVIASKRDHICWSAREFYTNPNWLETAFHLDMNGLSTMAFWQGTLRFLSKYLFFFTAPEDRKHIYTSRAAVRSCTTFRCCSSSSWEDGFLFFIDCY